MFGTFYMPANELPDDYGIGEPDFPKSFGGQLLYPLKDKADGAAAEPAAGMPGARFRRILTIRTVLLTGPSRFFARQVAGWR